MACGPASLATRQQSFEKMSAHVLPLLLLTLMIMAPAPASASSPSRLPRPTISFSADEQLITVEYNGTIRTVRRPVTPAWNYSVKGKTFWVSPAGSDSGEGTKASPLQTLHAAVNRTLPGRGDAVFLLPGEYVALNPTSGRDMEGGKQHYIRKGGTKHRPLIVSCAPGSLGKVLLRADPTGNNKSLATPILTIEGNYTRVNGLILEGTAGLPNAPDCHCVSTQPDYKDCTFSGQY